MILKMTIRKKMTMTMVGTSFESIFSHLALPVPQLIQSCLCGYSEVDEHIASRSYIISFPDLLALSNAVFFAHTAQEMNWVDESMRNGFERCHDHRFSRAWLKTGHDGFKMSLHSLLLFPSTDSLVVFVTCLIKVAKVACWDLWG